ncbi:cytoplasmic protein, partial [Streptococcus suis]
MIGGIDTFDQAHVFLADSKTAEEMQTWAARLEDLEQMDIAHLIPSHSNPESKFDKTALSFTKAYLEKAIQVEAESADSAAFMAAMNQAFPNLP